jgi:hypothetical protein
MGSDTAPPGGSGSNTHTVGGGQDQSAGDPGRRIKPTHSSHIFNIPTSGSHVKPPSSSSSSSAAPKPSPAAGSSTSTPTGAATPQPQQESADTPPPQNQQGQQQEQQPQEGQTQAGAESSNPKIEIPKITPVVNGLDGKFVDEFGNILDWDGTVLGQVQGDLPSMVGRPVSADGRIQDADGQVVGYVSENYTAPDLKPVGMDLRADEVGNIYNNQGVIVGKLNEHAAGSASSDSKAPAVVTPSPSEIYLDVKSTHDGIQIILKIPTVFNNGEQEN